MFLFPSFFCLLLLVLLFGHQWNDTFFFPPLRLRNGRQISRLSLLTLTICARFAKMFLHARNFKKRPRVIARVINYHKIAKIRAYYTRAKRQLINGFCSTVMSSEVIKKNIYVCVYIYIYIYIYIYK